jgi:hypothetical protein
MPQIAANVASFLAPLFRRDNHFNIWRHQLKSVRFNSQIGTLIIKSKAPEHRTQVLLREQNSPKTPLRKLSTINNLYIRNQKKPLQKITESMAQYSYRAYPLAKSNDVKLKKMKRKLQHNPAISIVPYLPKRAKETRKPVLSRHPLHFNRAKHAKTEPRKTENPYYTAIHTGKGTKYTRTGPALHTAETHTHGYIRDPARKENSHESNTPN